MEVCVWEAAPGPWGFWVGAPSYFFLGGGFPFQGSCREGIGDGEDCVRRGFVFLPVRGYSQGGGFGA